MGVKTFKDASLEAQEIRSRIGTLKERIYGLRGYL